MPRSGENHPLKPFLPPNAKLLMLGTFPPGKKRWSMDFFYPNFQNDMWRIFGLAFFGDKNKFALPEERRFDREKIESFLRQKGIALYDTAESAVRLKENASDKHLQIVRKTNPAKILSALPACKAVVCTGSKAAETFAESVGSAVPGQNEKAGFSLCGRNFVFYRAPSSSRAYPKPLAEKAFEYAKIFRETGVL